MSNAYQVARDAMTQSGDANEDDTSDMIVDALYDAALLAPEPQIIRTVAELEAAWACDPFAVLIGRTGDVVLAREIVDYEMTNLTAWLPAVKVATGEHVRACREALGADDG